MKNLKTLVLAAAMLFAGASVMFTSCTKEGPQGPPGANGTDGKDANATCTQCHNFGDSLVAKIVQYDASQHAMGETFFENRNTCAPCHTSQGYQECLKTGADTTATAINDPAPTNCRTCHKIHETYSTADFALRTTAPYTMRIDHTITIDLAADGGSGNLCGKCHQPRLTSPWVTLPNSETDSLKPTSFRWGPHYGTQSAILSGKGAFEFTDGVWANTPHRDVTACVTCHGATAVGNLTGGHTLWLANEEEGDNLNGCKNASCHPTATSFDIDGKQTEIEGLYATLGTKLGNFGMLDTTTGYLVTGKKYSQKMLAIFWNYKLVMYDRSMGVHNYKFTRDMLQYGINYMGAKGY